MKLGQWHTMVGKFTGLSVPLQDLKHDKPLSVIDRSAIL